MTAAVATEPTAPVAAPRRVRWAYVLLVAAPIVVFAVMAWQRRWMADDGFINLRVVDQLKAGNGPVFNRGERVETGTSPLWVYVLTLADIVLPMRSEWVSVLLGLACAVAGVALVMFGASRLTRPRDDAALASMWPVPIGILLFVVVSPAWDFASAGLEMGLVFLWLAACLTGLATWARSGKPASLTLMVLLGIGPLIRPDFLLYSVVFLLVPVVADWKRSTARMRVMWVLAWVALPGLYEIFRMGYYGALVPNTAFAKAADKSSYAAGWHYLTNLVGTYWLWVPMLVVLAVVAVPLVRRPVPDDTASRARGVVIAFVLGALVHAAYIVRVGGDYMHGRLLLPALFAFVAPFALVWMPRTRLAAVALGVVAVWAVVCGGFLRSPHSSFGSLVWDDRQVLVDSTQNEHPVLATERYGATSVRHLPPRLYIGATASTLRGRDVTVQPGVHLPAVMTYAIGATGYLAGTDTYLVDRLGLGDVFTAHLELTRRGLPGHEKTLPAHYAIARFVAPGTAYNPRDFDVDPLAEWRRGMALDQIDDYVRRRDNAVPLEQRVAQSRRLLQCPEVERLLDTARAPMSASRFFRNLVDSVRTYRTEIPWEPADALRKLC